MTNVVGFGAKTTVRAQIDGTDVRKGGPSRISKFHPKREGRHKIRIPRQHMRTVGNEHRRFVLEWTWQEDGQPRTLKRPFFVRR